MSASGTFTPEVYAAIREGAQRSAAAIVPLVMDFVAPRRVLDVGCGEGWFAREFFEAGCDVFAIDESVDVWRFEIKPDGGPRLDFQHVDLGQRNWAARVEEEQRALVISNDLAVCLEVAEHLPAERAEDLIEGLCRLAPVVLFSAAIPGQGGHGHVNEQPPGYWVEKFEARGYAVSGALRWLLWGRPDVEPWYQQNLLVAVRDVQGFSTSHPAGGHRLFGIGSFSDPIHVVHPTTFEYWVGLAGRR